MKAIERHLNEMDRIEREINKTKSWKRKNDLMKYNKRLKRELREYIAFHKL
jgi:hypothetical protein